MAEVDLFFWWTKPKKWIKSKNTLIYQTEKISVQLDDKYHKIGENAKIQKNLR